MVRMVVAQINVVGLEPLRSDLGIGGIVPPRSPRDRPKEPRIDENGGAASLDVEGCVADDRQSHVTASLHLRRAVPLSSDHVSVWSHSVFGFTRRRELGANLHQGQELPDAGARPVESCHVNRKLTVHEGERCCRP